MNERDVHMSDFKAKMHQKLILDYTATTDPPS